MNSDLLLDENNEPILANGDFTIGGSDAQHIIHILTASTGMYKNAPLTGVGVRKTLCGFISLSEITMMRSGLKSHGYNVKISYTNGELIITQNE